MDTVVFNFSLCLPLCTYFPISAICQALIPVKDSLHHLPCHMAVHQYVSAWSLFNGYNFSWSYNLKLTFFSTNENYVVVNLETSGSTIVMITMLLLLCYLSIVFILNLQVNSQRLFPESVVKTVCLNASLGFCFL